MNLDWDNSDIVTNWSKLAGERKKYKIWREVGIDLGSFECPL